MSLASVEVLKAFINVKKGLARPNRFNVAIYPVGKHVLPLFQTFDGITLRFLAETVQLPGRSFTTNEVKIHGPSDKKPYESIYENLQITFFLTNGLTERKTFTQWQEAIQNPKTGDFSYYDDYLSNIEVSHFDSGASDITDATAKVAIYECYPVSVGEIQYDMGANNQLAKLTVTFAYKYWENTK